MQSGETVLLGGMIKDTDINTKSGVPLLSSIPVLGNLFKTTTKTNDKDELLIFVTPKILHEGVNVY